MPCFLCFQLQLFVGLIVLVMMSTGQATLILHLCTSSRSSSFRHSTIQCLHIFTRHCQLKDHNLISASNQTQKIDVPAVYSLDFSSMAVSHGCLGLRLNLALIAIGLKLVPCCLLVAISIKLSARLRQVMAVRMRTHVSLLCSAWLMDEHIMLSTTYLAL